MRYSEFADPEVLRLEAYSAPTFEWWTQSATGTQTQVASMTIASPVGAWQRFRTEGIRSACHVRGFLDGTFLSAWTGACDMTGTFFALQGDANPAFNSAQVAWSNMATYKGSAAVCVP